MERPLFFIAVVCQKGIAMAEEKSQIKSKERVRERGEVFTAEREVNAMLDLVKDETERIDSTFLEPACGDGNFLAEILRRKLAVANRVYGKSAADYEKYSFYACTSIYGVDIMADNVERCRERLYDIWEGSFVPRLKTDFHGKVAASVKKVLVKNILLGNALSMKLVDDKGDDLDNPIVFTEWKFALGDKIKRAEFRFDVLLEKGEAKGAASEMMFDFMDDTSSSVNWMVDPDDPEQKRMIPAPVKEHAPVEYWRIGDE